MEYDAFTEGIDPGGLRRKSEIRLLICYILSSVDSTLSSGAISKILQEKGLANYFEVQDALGALLKAGNVAEIPEGFLICESGKEIASALDTSLPLSVRNKALDAALLLLAETKLRSENRVEAVKNENGYTVTCHISNGRSSDLMSVSLYVPDEKQANAVKSNFQRDPEGFYRLILSALTGDRELAEAFFKK